MRQAIIWNNGDPIHWRIYVALEEEELKGTGGCFTNVSRALQNFLLKFVYRKNRTSYENFKLKLCMCAQSHALGTRTKFQLEILTINGTYGIVYFRKISLESSRNVSETTPRYLKLPRNFIGFTFKYSGTLKHKIQNRSDIITFLDRTGRWYQLNWKCSLSFLTKYMLFFTFAAIYSEEFI